MSSRLIFLISATVLAWILAFNSGRELAYNLAYLLTSVLIFSYAWAWNSLRAIGLRRITRTRRSQVGQFAEEQFEVTNRGRWPKLWLEIKDDSTLPWHEASRVISNLGRGATQRWQVKTLCTQRGRFRLGPLSLHSGDPVGIFDVEQHIDSTGYIVVYPLVVELTSFEPSISDLSGGEARHRRTYQITTNVAGVREYVTGDSLNRIHWPSTARARRLMAKEFELDPTADIWLYLDLNQAAEAALPWVAAPPEQGLFALHSPRRKQARYELPPSTTEYAVTVTASLARYFVLRNRAVGMSSRGKAREFVQADRGERQLNKILEALAVATAVGNLPFAHLIATDGIRLNRNDTVLAISADPSPDWAIALEHLQRRGVNSIAVVIDGSSFGRADSYAPLLGELEAGGVPTYRVRRGDDLASALSQAARIGDIPEWIARR
ncbi:MAG: DUF58 domain-containing protein [Chloroflexi bacterium]|nr:MAG: DUF58 domain-containing protein [Chloroflexota bacterium]